MEIIHSIQTKYSISGTFPLGNQLLLGDGFI